MPSLPSKLEMYLILAEKLLKKNFVLKVFQFCTIDMKTRVCLIYFFHDCLWKQFLLLTRPSSFRLNFLDSLGNYEAFHTVSIQN